MKGTVYLVGAGPGDLGLITVKGLDLVRKADIIVYDALANPALLNECPNAEKIDVGKRGGNHKKTQTQINEILVECAGRGKTVVRLKGGDPFLFGRGAEEASELRKAGVKVVVVPGVSSSISVPEIAGIPVTHRDHSSLVTFITGHERSDREEDRIDWKALVDRHGTIVILMGMSNAPSISSQLIEGGMSPDMPVAVITDGSTPKQKCSVSVLSDLAAMIERDGLKAPGIIVIGNVVKEREILGDLV